jgi:hypothetical protein
VRAELVDEAEGAGAVAVEVEDEVFALEADRFRRALVKLGDGGYGVPVAAHQLAHGSSLADGGECLVLFC